MFSQFDLSLLILVILFAFGIFSQNHTISIATGILIIIKILPINQYIFPYFQQYGLTIGVIILTVGVLTPVATGKVSPKEILNSFLSLQSIIAIFIGIFVAWLGAKGTHLMTVKPNIIAGLLVGTVIGVAFLRGVPVGPLIAAGLLSLVLWK